MIPEDLRILALRDWLENDLLMLIEDCTRASSDASFRRYFRVKTLEGTFIVMDAPPDKENIAPFIRIAELFRHAQLHVPAIYQQNHDEGFLLLEDFGSQSFLEALNAQTRDSLYQCAMDNLFKLQSHIDLTSCELPQYDMALLQRELGIFEEWFLEKLLDVLIPTSVWQQVCVVVMAAALEQPQVCVHRDYHSRNLMVLPDNTLGLLDFQDAVIGAITYDLVSLLRDCYTTLPEDKLYQYLSDYHHRLQQAQFVHSDFNQFKRWFDLMGLQRHLKAVGIFARLHLRDNKSSYLADIPRTLAYMISVCANYRELADFHDFLQRVILPAYPIAR